MQALRFLLSRLGRVRIAWLLPLAVSAFYFGIVGVGVFLIAFRLNFLQIDLAGHLASAVSFFRFGLHGWNDSFFLGSIQNLFYPPLEDILLGSALKVASLFGFTDPVLVFKAYLIVIWTGYTGALFFLSRQLRHPWFALLGFAILLGISKETSVTYQGLSLMDLVRTGLTSQFLGGVFFILLLRELISDRRSTRVAFFLTLSILSHIVMGFVAVALLVSMRLGQKECRRGIKELGVSLGMTAFFWIPFVAYRGFLEAGKVVITAHLELSALAAVSFLTFIKIPKMRWAILLCALILLPNTLGAFSLSAYEALPVFHYYRFVMPAILILWTVLNLRSSGSRPLEVVSVILSVLLIAVIARDSRFMQIDLQSTYYKPAEVTHISLPKLQGVGRVWTIGKERTSDFGMDSFLSVLDPDYRSVKGLFWESSRSNSLISSFIATFLGPHGVVLPHQYFEGINCDQTACMMNRFIDDFGITRIQVDREFVLPYLKSPRRACMAQIFQKEKRIGERKLIAVGGFRDEELQYVAYDILPKSPPIRISSLDHLKMIRSHGDESLRTYLESCLDPHASAPTLIPDRKRGEIEEAIQGRRSAISDLGSVDRIQSGEYAVSVPAKDPVLFHLPISYLPGLRLTDVHGKVLPHFESYPGLLGVGHGAMKLSYHRPLWMWVGYGISILSVLVVMVRQLLNRCRRLNQTQTG